MKKDHNWDILIKLYDDAQIQRRHHETTRTTLSTILIALDTALFVACTTVCDGSIFQIFLSSMLVVFGLFGVVISLSHKDRYDFYWRRSTIIRKYMDENYCDGCLSKVYDLQDNFVPISKEDMTHMTRLPLGFRHHLMWTYLHGLIAVLGIVLMFIC